MSPHGPTVPLMRETPIYDELLVLLDRNAPPPPPPAPIRQAHNALGIGNQEAHPGRRPDRPAALPRTGGRHHQS